MIREYKGQKYALQSKWSRITENPEAPDYPCTGQKIELNGHIMIPDGKYIVSMVTEFEPPFHPDGMGRDIRISLLGSGKD